MGNLSAVFGKNSPKAYGDFAKKSKGLYAYLGLTPSPIFEKYKSVLDTPTLVGVEIEVENIKSEIGGLPEFWEASSDGSLRNSGVEFKSLPLNAGDSFVALDLIWKLLYKASTSKPDFSWRSSIHFHVNAMELESSEFKRWIQLALMFEGLFFLVAGPSRAESNFCVPLTRSNLMDTLRKYFHGKIDEKKLWKTWNAAGGADSGHGLYKYSAINFSRLGDLGTVEFRHLGGTKELPRVCLLLAMALSLYKAAVAMTDLELSNLVNELSTSKSYSSFVKKVLGPKLYAELGEEVDYVDLMSGSVLKVKELLIDPPQFTEFNEESSLGVLATAAAKRQEMLKKGGPKLKK